MKNFIKILAFLTLLNHNAMAADSAIPKCPITNPHISNDGTTGICSSAASTINILATGVSGAVITTTGTAAPTLTTSTAFTIGTLPAGVAGMRSYITNQLTACVASGAALVAGGSVTCPVFYNGSAWVGD